MKNLLVITLLFLVGCGSFEVTKFSCNLSSGTSGVEHFNLRVDERRKKLRLNMEDEIGYEDKGWYIEANNNPATTELFKKNIRFRETQTLEVEWFTTDKFNRSVYFDTFDCKMI